MFRLIWWFSLFAWMCCFRAPVGILCWYLVLPGMRVPRVDEALALRANFWAGAVMGLATEAVFSVKARVDLL